jgi:hypothetical protein
MGTAELDRFRADVLLDGIRWVGDDVIFTLSRQSPKDALVPPVEMRCVRTTNLEVRLDMKDWIGRAFTWDAEYSPLPRERSAVRMDFAQRGFIRFECDAVEIDGQRVSTGVRG